MICYIKGIKDFKTIEKYNIVEYSISDGEDGSVKVDTAVPVSDAAIYSGCWMIISFIEREKEEIPYSLVTEEQSGGTSVEVVGKNLKVKENVLPDGGIEYVINSYTSVQKQKVYYISECMPEKDSLTFTIKHPIYAFTRRILYSGERTWGAFIKNVLNNGFGTGCPDRNFCMRYMTVQGSSNTECSVETDVYGYIIPYEYFEYARKVGVNIDFSVLENNRLLVSIFDVTREYGIVVFNDGHSQLEDETYAANTYSKISVIQELNEDGRVIGTCDSKEVPNYDAAIFVEICQDIANSYLLRKSMLKARIVSSWAPAESAVSFKNCSFSIRLNSSSGSLLLNTTFEWEIKADAGYATSGWFPLTELDETSTCILYASVIPDQYPNEVENSNYTTLNYTINVSDIIPRSDVKFGPLNSEYHQAMYRIVDYYLSKDGSISTSPPVQLADGEWVVIDASSDESPYYVAADAFSQNSDNHKIEFYSDKYFDYYQPIRMRIRSGVFETIVTSRTVSSSDSRYYYKCGRLLTRLTEKVNALNGQRG